MHVTKDHPSFKAASKMPLLSHHMHGEPFDITKSEVVRWLIAQPALQQELFNQMKRTGAIVWDAGRWRGADTSSTG